MIQTIKKRMNANFRLILGRSVFGLWIIISGLQASEGMWLLTQMQQKKRYEEAQKMGLKLSSEEIYSLKNPSLKDAIVSFGGFCTGEIISPQGLILTNHHCGYDAIQKSSSIENNYLRDGFWAKNNSEEIPVQGLFVRILDSMTEVTAQILAGYNEKMSETDRLALLKKNQEQILADLKIDQNTQYAEVKSFYEGNAFYLFLFKQFNDIRLVGTPQESIGKFGGDTDNWMWPRHTGDFSMFRIYADAQGQPANYKANNQAYTPKHYFPISLEPIEENDFSMIMGFPGTTNRYMTSFEIKDASDSYLPANVMLRKIKMDILKEGMEKDPTLRLKYASMYAHLANYWKNFTGKIQDFKKNRVVEKKAELEKKMLDIIQKDEKLNIKYGQTLANIQNAVEENSLAIRLGHYNREIIMREGIPLAELFMLFRPFLEDNNTEKKEFSDENVLKLLEKTDAFYKNYDAHIALNLTEKLLQKFTEDWAPKYYGEKLTATISSFEKQWKDQNNKQKKGQISIDSSTIILTLSRQVFGKSVLMQQEKIQDMIKNKDLSKIKTDLAYQILDDLFTTWNKVSDKNKTQQLQKAKREWLQVLELVQKKEGAESTLYADANSTLRLTYGKVLGYEPKEALIYRYYTTDKGILEKENPDDEEFIVPPILHDKLMAKDFGPYKVKDYLPVNFLTDHDITGGNSGSPVINAKGELIGCAFDGVWENMMGDMYVDMKVQRTISVDMHYVLFVIDKIGHAGHLIQEMKIIGTEAKNPINKNKVSPLKGK